MKTEARARGLAGWTRGRALGDGVCGRSAASAEAPSVHTQSTALGGRVPQPRDSPLRIPAEMMRGGAPCAILIASRDIKNRRK